MTIVRTKSNIYFSSSNLIKNNFHKVITYNIQRDHKINDAHKNNI